MDFWVFAYGSLMWRPNFKYVESAPALLEGAHRALCLYSAVHRGTYEAPGLVLGLDKGGHCMGMAFRVHSDLVRDTRAYLHRRENTTNAYVAVHRPVKLLDGTRREVAALSYQVNLRHPQYAGKLPLPLQAHLVRRSAGASGTNLDYVMNTVEHLRALGVYDLELERLMAILGRGAPRGKSLGFDG